MVNIDVMARGVQKYTDPETESGLIYRIACIFRLDMMQRVKNTIRCCFFCMDTANAVRTTSSRSMFCIKRTGY